MYMSDGVRETAFLKKSHDGDLGAAQVWNILGTQPFEDPDYTGESKAVAI